MRFLWSYTLFTHRNGKVWHDNLCIYTYIHMYICVYIYSVCKPSIVVHRVGVVHGLYPLLPCSDSCTNPRVLQRRGWMCRAQRKGWGTGGIWRLCVCIYMANIYIYIWYIYIYIHIWYIYMAYIYGIYIYGIYIYMAYIYICTCTWWWSEMTLALAEAPKSKVWSASFFVYYLSFSSLATDLTFFHVDVPMSGV